MMKVYCDYCGSEVTGQDPHGAGTLTYVHKTLDSVAPHEKVLCGDCLHKALSAVEIQNAEAEKPEIQEGEFVEAEK